MIVPILLICIFATGAFLITGPGWSLQVAWVKKLSLRPPSEGYLKFQRATFLALGVLALVIGVIAVSITVSAGTFRWLP